MSTDHECRSPLTRLTHALDELKHALIDALEGHSQCATKQDLHEMEERVLAEIRATNPTPADLKALDALLVRSKRTLRRLSALDAQTDPK